MSRRPASIARRRPNICSTSWPPPDHWSLGGLSSPKRRNGHSRQAFAMRERKHIGRREFMPKNQGNRSNRGGNRSNERSAFGWTDTARENPLVTAAAVGAAAAAGAFLWSRRNQI